MSSHQPPSGSPLAPSGTTGNPSSWSARYGDKHRLRRVTVFPRGIIAPQKVRLYTRTAHYVLQWWDPAAKTNLADRVEGDLVAAITRARQIEERLAHFRASGQGRPRRLAHAEVVAQFLADLRRRADAAEVDPATVTRYEAALRHYRAFCEQPAVARTHPHACSVNRAFRLALAAFLATRAVARNGHPASPRRPMRGQAFVLGTVRALYAWAADPERGGLLPAGFRNPFVRAAGPRTVLHGDPLAGPDISVPMALDLVAACDAFQLRLFVPLLLFGLRAAEPCFLFREHLSEDWLLVGCNPELNVKTKGRRDKRFPLLPDLGPFWELLRDGPQHGLLYERRAVVEGRERPPLRGRSLAELVAAYRQRSEAAPDRSAARRAELRDQVLEAAGGLNYHHIQGEFGGLARRLGWPAAATLKDLRHLFATTMNNAAMPEGYRRYLMGQAPGRAAILAYTHLNQLREHYAAAVRREWTPLLDAVNHRAAELTAAAVVS